MQTSESSDDKTKGFAIVALRAYVKALEMEEGIQQGGTDSPFRYQIDDNAGTAAVIDTRTGVVEFEDPITDWADEGKMIRLAFIGLKAMKMQLEAELAARESNLSRIRYHLNAAKGEAFLRNGRDRVPGLPLNLEDWEEMGRSVEQRLFAQLRAAELRGAEGEVRRMQSLMKQVGVIVRH